jgi:hypothetical protein
MPDTQEPPQSDSMPITFIIGNEVFPPVPISSLPDMSHLHLSTFTGWLRAHHPPTRRPLGRPKGPPDPELIEDILQWMRGRRRQGTSVDDLTQDAYVLHRWSDRYGEKDEVLEGSVALVRAMLTPKRKQKKSIQSGVRWFRKYRLKPTGHSWAELQQRALAED